MLGKRKLFGLEETKDTAWTENMAELNLAHAHCISSFMKTYEDILYLVCSSVMECVEYSWNK